MIIITMRAIFVVFDIRALSHYARSAYALHACKRNGTERIIRSVVLLLKTERIGFVNFFLTATVQ